MNVNRMTFSECEFHNKCVIVERPLNHLWICWILWKDESLIDWTKWNKWMNVDWMNSVELDELVELFQLCLTRNPDSESESVSSYFRCKNKFVKCQNLWILWSWQNLRFEERVRSQSWLQTTYIFPFTTVHFYYRPFDCTLSEMQNRPLSSQSQASISIK